MSGLRSALLEAGGVRAPHGTCARLRELLGAELDRGAKELERSRSGYETPVTVAIAPARKHLLAVAPVAAEVATDSGRADERGTKILEALVGALVDVADVHEARSRSTLRLETGRSATHICLRYPTRSGEEGAQAELATLAFAEQLGKVDKVRCEALAVPGHVVEAGEFRKPPGHSPPLLVAEAIARAGGRPSVDQDERFEPMLLRLFEASEGVAAAHDDPDPGRRIARRILRTLRGKGKWGRFYHTEFRHLARGFEAKDTRHAIDIAEALLAAGLLVEKQSVGQRHASLNPRRAAEIHALVDEGVLPAGLVLPS